MCDSIFQKYKKMKTILMFVCVCVFFNEMKKQLKNTIFWIGIMDFPYFLIFTNFSAIRLYKRINHKSVSFKGTVTSLFDENRKKYILKSNDATCCCCICLFCLFIHLFLYSLVSNHLLNFIRFLLIFISSVPQYFKRVQFIFHSFWHSVLHLFLKNKI